MACRSPRRTWQRLVIRRSGFTLIELCVVIVIIGIITSIGMANFIRFRSRAGYSACVSNQRHTLEAAVLYVSTANPGTINLDVNFLTAAGFLNKEVAECPSSTIDDWNDYAITIVNNRVTLLRCKEEPVQHAWTLP